MRTKEQKDRADKLVRYAIVAGAIVSLSAMALWVFTDREQPAVRILTTVWWLMFAVANWSTFYRGEVRWKGGPTYTREEAPRMFYLSTIFFTAGSMSIMTLLLWAAFFSK